MAASKTKDIAIRELCPAGFQPRTRFEQTKILELAESIREHGILQPLLVQKKNNSGYEIIAGERRYRAAHLLGLSKIPCRVMKLAETECLAVALVENIQREDLNPIEEARAYFRIQQALKLSQEQIGRRVGKDRASVANTLRLLRLPKHVQESLASGDVTMGHARALLSLDSPDVILMTAKKITREGLSVRKTEQLVRAIKTGVKTGFREPPRNNGLPKSLEKEISRQLSYELGVKTLLKQDGSGFMLSLNFFDQNKLNNFLERLGIEL